jgi:hypothetical protein
MTDETELGRAIKKQRGLLDAALSLARKVGASLPGAYDDELILSAATSWSKLRWRSGSERPTGPARWIPTTMGNDIASVWWDGTRFERSLGPSERWLDGDLPEVPR